MLIKFNCNATQRESPIMYIHTYKGYIRMLTNVIIQLTICFAPHAVFRLCLQVFNWVMIVLLEYIIVQLEYIITVNW